MTQRVALEGEVFGKSDVKHTAMRHILRIVSYTVDYAELKCFVRAKCSSEHESISSPHIVQNSIAQ